MVISKTPLRISFFGGGTDFPQWYRDNGGSILTLAIDKYCYISCRFLPPFFEHKHRIVYSRIELVKEVEEIIHPAVKGVFKFFNIKDGLEIHHDGDLPARSGMGSSSAFTVGLINAIYALYGKIVSKKQLALDAIHVEQEIIKESVGSQDQTIASFGGFNRIDFFGEHIINVTPVTLSKQKLDFFMKHFMLFYTGISRISSDIAKHTINNITNKKEELKTMKGMVDSAIKILSEEEDFTSFGKLLEESWLIKKKLSDKISNTTIDDIYNKAKKAGAIGGKLLGAGGGGFLLLLVPLERQESVKKALKNLLYVPFGIDWYGSQIIYYSGAGNL